MSSFSLDPNAKGFSLQNALSLALASRLAYLQPYDVRLTAKDDWGFTECEFFSEGNTQGFVASNPEATVVAFRGTEPNQIKDWLTDANIDPTEGPFGSRVHGGFEKALDEAWGSCINKMQMVHTEGKSLWLTGHSLGAALATLTAARLLADNQTVNGLYTFGQPRTGKKSFALAFDERFKGQTFRFVNNNDIVTQLPPRPYKHVGTLKYFTDKGVMRDKVNFWALLVENIAAFLPNLLRGNKKDLLAFGTDSVKDHEMDGYIQCIEQQLGP